MKSFFKSVEFSELKAAVAANQSLTATQQLRLNEIMQFVTPATISFFSTNPRVMGDRNFAFSIIPTAPMRGQIEAQIGGVDCKTDEVLVLHPIPAVSTATIAFLRGKNNNFPTIALVAPDGVNVGEFDLHEYRHNVARPTRKGFLETADNLSDDAVIIVNSSGRELPTHQIEQLKQLADTQALVVATLQLGQVDLKRTDLGEWLLETLTTALKGVGIGKSIASRRIIAVTAGLSPVNAIIVTALHALAESWCSHPVAVNQDGIFNFTDLIELAKFENAGRTK